jgi:DNA uptake protein ComE-like DNA-binding protein
MADQREHMERVIKEGGSVYHRGAIINNVAHLPSEAQLAKGDAGREDAARKSLAARRALLDAEEAELNTGSIGQPPASTQEAPSVDADAIPDDFPGHAALTEAGYSKLSQVNGLSEEELTEIPGIGPATAAKIIEARK